MSDELPRWATEMRDLFRSGSAAQFLLHGNVFDVVPSGGKLLSLPAFLDEVMFASYDVVLRYDRSRGVRATRGADDWGDWLQQALGREVDVADAAARAGLGAGADRSLPAAHAEPAGAPRRAPPARRAGSR